MDTLKLLGQVLECSVCLEQLDATSKVLPCQHTFCQKCLLDILNAHKELRCPECRTLVTVPFHSLQSNLLLIRILEEMKNMPSSSLQNQSSVCDNNVLTASLPAITPSSSESQVPAVIPDVNSVAGNGFSYSRSDSNSSVLSNNPFTDDFFASINNRSEESVILPPNIFHQNFKPVWSQSSILSDSEALLNFDSLTTSSSISQSSSLSLAHPTAEVSQSSSSTCSTTVSLLDKPRMCSSLPISTENAAIDVAASAFPKSNVVGRALYNYEGKETRDLKFKKGDVINIIKSIDSNWCLGEVDGHTGFVPVSYLAVADSPISSSLPQCKTLYDFKMAPERDQNCLNFTKGQIISVLRQVDENWVEGKLNSRIGIFPLSFVELNEPAKELLGKQGHCSLPPRSVDQKILDPKTNANSGSYLKEGSRICIAQFTYQPRKADELELKKGQLYTIEEVCQDGWYKGRALASEKIGVYPGNYVKLAPTSSQGGSNITCFTIAKSKCASSRVGTNDTCLSIADASPVAPVRENSITLSSPASSVHIQQLIKLNSPEHSTKPAVKPVLNQKETSPKLRSSLTSSSSSPSKKNSSYDETNLTIKFFSKDKLGSANTKQPAPLAKERYRCLASYPANGEAELDLVLGDIVYVHKKLQDGWYQGTLQRTGKTGFFPSIFVEPC